MKKSKFIIWATILSMVLLTGCKKETEESVNVVDTMVVETETETESETESEYTLPEGMMYSYLTGEPVSIEDGMQRPLALMINNVQEALPQSGISQAGILYEAVVESDITRLMAVFETAKDIEKVGPIRSCRHYYLDFAHDEEAVYGHFGWSYVAENRINQSGQKTLNFMFANNGTAYYRATDRVAPHNVYTSSEMLESAYSIFNITDTTLPENYEGRLLFNEQDTPLVDGEEAVTVSIPFSSQSRLVYDETTGVYMKFQYGSEHMDDQNNQQLSFKNIIIQKAAYSQYNGDILKDIALTGSGEGYYITDGKAVAITWKKDDLNSDHTRYYLADGTQLVMNQGKTYIAVVPTNFNIELAGK